MNSENMEIVKVLGIDPSLRWTGLSIVEFNTETNEFKVNNCQLITCPVKKFKGLDAINHMIEQLAIAQWQSEFLDCNHVVVESPVMPFNAKFQGGSMISVAHIAGACAAYFGQNKNSEKIKLHLVRPGTWNHCKQKEITHKNTQDILGPWEEWGFKKVIKSIAQIEHILDAASMALWYIQKNYLEDEE